MPYKINGTDYYFAEPFFAEGTTFVPLGDVADSAGCITEWDNLAKVATVELDAIKARIQADNPKVEVGAGNYVELQAPPYLEDGKLWVPVRLFESVFHCTIAVEGETVSVTRKF